THLTHRAGPGFNCLFSSTYAVELPRRTCAALALIAKEPVLQGLLGGLAGHVGDRRGERDPLLARVDAVRGLSAVRHATLAHEPVQPLAGIHRSRRVRVEEADLRDRRRAQ